jgi:hypothetical protein
MYLNGEINYYDIYVTINGKEYNIDGSFGADRDETRILILKPKFTLLHEMPFHPLNSKDPVQEGIALLTKIVNLKAFL